MNILDALKVYPEKSFQETLDEKLEFLKSKISKEQIDSKRNDVKRIFFQYDDYVKELKYILSNYDGEIDDFTIRRATFHFHNIWELNSYLDKLNYWNNQDINFIFYEFFKATKRDWYYLHKIVEAMRKKTYIEELTFEVKVLINSFSNIDLEKAIEKEKEKIKDAIKIANDLVDNKEKYEDAAKKAENWIKEQEKTLLVYLQKEARAFSEKAQENKKSSWWFLWWGISSWVFAILFLFYIFIFESSSDISVWASLLRISIFVAISYFTFFALSHFFYDKKLYENYKFKAMALEKMKGLIKSYWDDRQKILDKAMSIIFDEPSLKENNSNQKKMFEIFMDLLKNWKN